MKQMFLKKGQYILRPFLYDSGDTVKLANPLKEDSKSKNGEDRVVLRVYKNNNFLGSPICRRSDEEKKGLKVFIPSKEGLDWTVIQVFQVFKNSVFGLPIVLEKGLLLSYFEYCRELYNYSLSYNEEKQTIKPDPNLNLPSFEYWMKNKEGYKTYNERKKEQNLEVSLHLAKEKIKNLNKEISVLSTNTKKIKDNLLNKLSVLKLDLESLEIKDEEVQNDISNFLEAIEDLEL